METNNQVTNKCEGCDSKMCQNGGTCCSKKGCKIAAIVIAVIVVIFIGKMAFGGHCEWRDNKGVVNTITVSGKGEKMATPDIAQISFGVSAENMDVGKAQTESATKINNIIDLLKTKGVDVKDIKTTNYSINPRYDYIQASTNYPYGGKQVLAGYTVSQTVEVKIRKIADAGAILSGVGEFGVTDVSGLNFLVDAEDTLKLEARNLAIKDAKDQAEVLAKELGIKLVKITSFSESNNYPVYRDYMMSAKAEMAPSSVAPQVPAGENTITSNVSITYEIK